VSSSPRLRISARWVLPVTSAPIENGAVLITADGRIAAVGPADQVPGDSVGHLDLGEAVLLPGLVNVHAHPELAGFRGLLDDLPFHQWIPTLMRCKRAAELTDEDYLTAARWTTIETLRAGMTTVAATETSGAAVTALAESGQRGVVYLETFGPAPEQANASLAELRERIAKLGALVNDRVQLGVSPHAPYTVSDDLYQQTANFARVEGLPMATHAAEAEVEELLIREGAGPFAAGLRTRGIATPPRGESTIELLQRLGVLSLKPLLIHCVRIDRDDIQRIRDSGSTIAHCPIANARLGHGIAPIVEARAAGIPVALGTDSVASNNRLDLLEEARVAQLAQRGRLAAAGPLPAQELLELVTLCGARALGLDDRIGSLDPGKDADLCAVTLTGSHTLPSEDPLATLFHAAGASDVIMTMVQGRVLFDGRTVITQNEAELEPCIRELGVRLRNGRDQPQ
jgi:cytosine/adenosine deaminase-related metal-dependent hydrolase